MMLRCGSQSCVRNGDKAGQRCEENGGEAHQISLEDVSFRLCGEFHCFAYAFHWYVSLLSLNSALMLHLGSCKRISRATRLLRLWLHDATTDRMPESGIMVQPAFLAISYEELCDTNPSKPTRAPWHARWKIG